MANAGRWNFHVCKGHHITEYLAIVETIETKQNKLIGKFSGTTVIHDLQNCVRDRHLERTINIVAKINID